MKYILYKDYPIIDGLTYVKKGTNVKISFEYSEEWNGSVENPINAIITFQSPNINKEDFIKKIDFGSLEWFKKEWLIEDPARKMASNGVFRTSDGYSSHMDHEIKTEKALSILIPTIDDRYMQYYELCKNKLHYFLAEFKKEKYKDQYIEVSQYSSLIMPDNFENMCFKEKEELKRKLHNEDYVFPFIEVIGIRDNKEMSIGEKRELLYSKASGKYSWQIDDDDSISDNAINLILEAIKQEPDCITFQENCMINGKYYSSNHSLKYDDWADNFDGFDFVRTPFYKDVIKTSIAQSVPFQHIRYGEDHAWSRDLKPHLKSEVHIDKEIYYYIHNSQPEDFNSRYGFDTK